MYELLGAGIANLMQVKYLLPLFIGTLAGVVGGALPGVTITMTIIVVLPFTFGLDPPRDLRGWGRVALVALVAAAATYVVFERELLVLLPRGSWTGF